MMLRKFIIVTLITLGACSTDTTDVVDVIDLHVEHGDSANDYKLSWVTEPANQNVRLEWSTEPNFQPGSGEEIVSTDKTEFFWAASGEPQRRYFSVIPEQGKAASAAVRLLPLEGGRNFRDIGGYATTDGRQVKWGKVFRSGVMNELTTNDYDYLSDLGIRTVCDFRDERERTDEPTQWQAGQIDYKVFADPVQESAEDNPMFSAFRDPNATPETIKTAMAKGYSHIAKNEVEGYTAMFSELVAGRLPLAFNCSAGKDRAGTAAALILTALGVPEEMVVHDYSLSDDYVDYMAEFAGPDMRAKVQADPDHPYGFLFKMPVENLEPLLASHPIYIETSFADIKNEYGTVLAFIQQELEVTDKDLDQLRSNLLH